MAAGGALRLMIDLEGSGEPIAGTIRTLSGEPVRFVGWMELVAALEALRAAGLAEDPKGGTNDG